ncbi:tripartite tricarboxylate transporter substrate binding protein [Xylophilus rhododendri]|uniref:Tripartite tricarboxylate transporter substrate binding protein n=1 Tax=Xylophilus rhododendri TaxID=2697032 RepID=A0A857JA76_9BURK|nr:tripartite tricarboxylate transporter substrate binding protein [Xylophilus rhododendri]QHJ00895.1 tripartite tricarboxylate transporter substrate binding protein [Xylophilus rhododendri]
MQDKTQAAQRRGLLRGAAAIGASALLPLGMARAQAYPERPINFICPWPAGGTADASMRALCSAAGKALGQPVVLENKAGASGMIGLKAITSARPDGYTIGQVPISVTRFYQLGMTTVDPRKDITWIARTSGQTFGIAVPANGKWKSMAELVNYAKAHPGEVTYAHSGLGGATHVGMEEFLIVAGIKMRDVPFKGGSEALQAVLGGHVDILVDSSSWAPHVESGKLLLLSTWGEQRTPRFAQTPTLKELGWDVVTDAPNGVGAPRGLDPAVEARLRDAFRQAAASEEFKRVCAQIDAPIMYLDGPQYQAYAESVYRKETSLIERLRLKELMKG